MKKRTKTLILCLSILVVTVASGFGLWYLLRDKAPVGNGNVLNVAWYHENGTEFTITTADELFEFAELSEYYTFKEQTIKLGADIVVNEGNAADWDITIPERSWESIRNFAGTFDGQGHTISGLYGLGHLYALKGADKIFYTTGMFSETNAKCTIKNFKLLNSYFCSDLNEGVGSISSSGGGTFENIYSDAIVVSYKSHNGGIVGLLDQTGTISNCWFDGEIRVEGKVGRFTGGIVGRVGATNGQSKIEHCLNTANISSTVINRGMNTGGLIGNIQSQARINITDCLTIGDIVVDYTAGVGAFVGNIESSSAVIIKNTYVKSEAFEEVIYNANGSLTGAAIAHNEATLTGFNAYKWTELDFKDYWAVVEDGTPVLKSFAENVPSVKGLKKGYDISWYKPTDGEFLIKTAEQLYGLAMLSYSDNFIGKAIYLGNDITLNDGKAEEWAEHAPDNRWFSIGTYGYPFEGVFDGQGYTVSGLYHNTCGGMGMFGEIGSSASISNLKLKNSYVVASGQTVGSIVGLAAGSMQNIYSDAIVVGHQGNVGGLAGQAKRYAGLQMSNCWFDGKVTNLGNKSDTKKIGGLIGAVRSESAVVNCLNTGTVDASVFDYNQARKKENGENVVDKDNPTVVPIVGGLIGYVEKEVPFGIQDCLNVGKVLYNEAATAAYASVIGYVDGDVTAQNVYAATESCDNHPLKQSVVGQVCPIDTADLTGYKAYQWTLLDFDKHWAVNKKGTPILKSFAEEVPSLEGVKKEVDVSWYSTDKKTFVLDSRQDLYGFRLMSYNTDFAEKTVKLGKDITVNTGNAKEWAKSAPKYEWTPIGTQKYSFMGTFDGGMHSISGIYLKTDQEFSGLFAILKEGTEVKNLKILNSYYESSADYMGSVVGSGNANLSNLYSNAILVSSANSASGFVGRSTKDITIKNCWFDGSATITGTGMPNRRAAGIVACIYSGKVELSHCLNTGEISAPNYTGTNSATSTAVVPLIGGLAGQVTKDAKVNIKDSLNTGKISCNPAATTGFSAIVGNSSGEVTITDTYATKESCEYQIRGTYTGHVSTYEEADISGYAGYRWLTLDFDKHWAVVVNPTVSTPVLKVFAKEVPSLAGIEKVIDTSWYNESKKEYVLNDMADLNGFAYLSNSNDFAGKTVKLGADIVVNQDMKNPTYKWDPIGTKNTSFAGTFDGQMHTISGLYTKTDAECAGLFASTAKDATVKNVILKDSYFESTAMNLGSIAGTGRGTFDTIKSEAIVVGHNARVGGLIGMNPTKGTKLTNCWFAGKVTNKGNGEGLRGTGGLVGVSYTDSDLVIVNCLNSGTVDASAYAFNQSKEVGKTNVTVLAGGLVGWFRKGGLLTIQDSLSVGVVKVGKAANNAYGSILGYTDGETKISGVYATAESSPYLKNGSKDGIIVVNENDILGIKAYQWNRLDALDFKKVWAYAEEKTPILKSFASKIIDVSKEDKGYDTSWYGNGWAKTFEISDMADLYGLAVLSREHDFEGKTIKLTNDIVVNTGDASTWGTAVPKYSWDPIGTSGMKFKGTFDGLDENTGEIHEISGIYLKANNKYAGFFAATGTGATIKNIKLTNSYFESQYTASEDEGRVDFAGLAGYAIGTFDNIYSDAIVVGQGVIAGGVLGYVAGNSTITHVWFDGSVTNTRNTDLRTGGLIGEVGQKVVATISDCLNTGVISAPNANTDDACLGGLVGLVRTEATMDNCLNVGKVNSGEATDRVGSIAGYAGTDGTRITVKNVLGTTESHKWKGVTKAKRESISKLRGESAKTTFSGIDHTNTWSLIENNIPVLKQFLDVVVDTSWFEQDPGAETFVLNDMQDLLGFAVLSQTNQFANKTVKLGDDIEFNKGSASTWGTTAAKYMWIPIGNATYPFAGTFDGYNTEKNEIYEISGIYLNVAQKGAGLFAQTSATAKVQNFKLVNSYIKNTDCSATGSIAGVGRGTFYNVHSAAQVYSNKDLVGGLVGTVGNLSTNEKGFTMSKCSFNGSVESSLVDKDIELGGLVGLVDVPNTTITNCLNTGTVASTGTSGDKVRDIGGLIGCFTGNSASGTKVTRLLNIGQVTVAHKVRYYVNSIIGYKNKDVKDTANLYSTSETTYGTEVDIEAIKGVNAKDTLEGFNFLAVWSIRENDTPVLNQAEMNEYILYTADDLYTIAEMSQTYDFAGKTIKLANDIPVNSGDATQWGTVPPTREWTPIGSVSLPFAGTFDGYNEETNRVCEISGIYLKTQQQGSGLFGGTSSTAKIRNLKLVNSYFESSSKELGSIAGIAQGRFSNIYSKATVKGTDTGQQKYIGGIVGKANAGFRLENSWFDGEVSSLSTKAARVGGLIGGLYESGQYYVYNCLNSGLVDVSGASKTWIESAGLVGIAPTGTVLTIVTSLNTGTVSYGQADTDVEAIVGYVKEKNQSTLTNVYATSESCARNLVYGGSKVSETDIKDSDKVKSTLVGFDFDTNWIMRDGEIPVPNMTPTTANE